MMPETVSEPLYDDDDIDPWPQWRTYGACRTSDLEPDAWFPITGDEPEAQAARALCAICPVRMLCLYDSMRWPHTHGIWGGFDETQRADMEIE